MHFFAFHVIVLQLFCFLLGFEKRALKFRINLRVGSRAIANALECTTSTKHGIVSGAKSTPFIYLFLFIYEVNAIFLIISTFDFFYTKAWIMYNLRCLLKDCFHAFFTNNTKKNTNFVSFVEKFAKKRKKPESSNIERRIRVHVPLARPIVAVAIITINNILRCII